MTGAGAVAGVGVEEVAVVKGPVSGMEGCASASLDMVCDDEDEALALALALGANRLNRMVEWPVGGSAGGLATLLSIPSELRLL
mgnify:CR=1 FL=1